MKMLRFKSLTLFILMTAAMTAHADQNTGGKVIDKAEMQMSRPHAKATSSMSMADGEVEDVDKENKSITLKHGPIKTTTIEMEPMTMPFDVKDASLLSKVKVGDKVKFIAEYIDGAVTITALRVVK
jgi:Cu/Ag efflux protein CusF